jgi:hypothetical protein
MAQALFIWLGAKRAEKRGVGEPGVLLDRATRAGLPVPRGGILLDDFYHSALNDGLFAVANGRLTCPDPLLLHDALYEAIRFPQLPKPVVVRPIFSPTDGRFPSQVNVHFTDPVQLADSLSAVYTSALAQPANVRRDVMVMEMVDVVVSGTAVTDTSDPSDTITYDDQSMTVPQLGHFQRASSDVPPFAQRLQKLLRGVRRTLGKGNWRIEWADDDDVCWLTQIMRLRTREEM